MRTLARLENWHIAKLTDDVIVGQIYESRKIPEGFTFFTDRILAIKGEYLITERYIFKLGDVDKKWIHTSEASILDEYEILS